MDHPVYTRVSLYENAARRVALIKLNSRHLGDAREVLHTPGGLRNSNGSRSFIKFQGCACKKRREKEKNVGSLFA